MSRFFEPGKVSPPVALVVHTQIVEYRPGIQARIVPVVEYEADGIAADRLDLIDVDCLFGGNENSFATAMALYLRRRREDAQILQRQFELLAIGEPDLQPARAFLQLDVDRVRGVHLENIAREILILHELAQMLVDIGRIDDDGLPALVHRLEGDYLQEALHDRV